MPGVVRSAQSETEGTPSRFEHHVFHRSEQHDERRLWHTEVPPSRTRVPAPPRAEAPQPEEGVPQIVRLPIALNDPPDVRVVGEHGGGFVEEPQVQLVALEMPGERSTDVSSGFARSAARSNVPGVSSGRSRRRSRGSSPSKYPLRAAGDARAIEHLFDHHQLARLIGVGQDLLRRSEDLTPLGERDVTERPISASVRGRALTRSR